MIIDFHTHAFPDAIADRTIAALEHAGGIPAYSRGTLAELRALAKAGDVDLSIVLPVVTKPSQFETINRFALEISREDGALSFGGIHPDCEDVETLLEQLKDAGFVGVKIHPDYQGVYIDDARYFRILEKCIDLGIYVVTHAGMDIAFPNDIHCPPQKMRAVLDRLYVNRKKTDARIILAHLGGNEQWDDVETYLVGQPVYFDLAAILSTAPTDVLLRIIRNHGADKILFATDSPWSDPKCDVAIVQSLPLSDAEKEQIFSGNARRILGLV